MDLTADPNSRIYISKVNCETRKYTYTSNLNMDITSL